MTQNWAKKFTKNLDLTKFFSKKYAKDTINDSVYVEKTS